MSISLVETIKQLARDEIKANKPVEVVFGTVTKEAPLEVTLDQWGTLTSEFLILTRNVTDYDVEMTVNHQVEKMSGGAKDPSFQSHIHQYKGRKPFRVHNALKAGERVVLLAVQGGQQYVILDRVGA